MLQVAVSVLFALAALVAMGTVGQALWRAWRAAGPLRAALAACDDVERVTVRTYALERQVVIPAAARFIPGTRSGHPAATPCGYRVAA